MHPKEFDYINDTLEHWLEIFADPVFHASVPDLKIIQETVNLVRRVYLTRLELQGHVDFHDAEGTKRLVVVNIWSKRLDEVDQWAEDMRELVNTAY